MSHADDADRLLPGDETLASEPLDLPSDPAERRACLEQRFVHGLLRAAHGADAASREGRVQAVLAAVGEAEGRRSGKVLRNAAGWGVRSGLLAAAAAAVFALTVWFGSASPLELQAVVASVESGRKAFAHCHYRVRVATIGPQTGVEQPQRSFTATIGPDQRLLVEGDTFIGAYRIGFDGKQLWCVPPFERNRWSRAVTPDSAVQQLLDWFPLCQADFDLGSLLVRLSDKALVVRVEVATLQDGTQVQRVIARDVGRVRGAEIRELELDVATDTGLIHRLRARTDRVFLRDRVIEFVLDEAERVPASGAAPDVSRYQRPW